MKLEISFAIAPTTFERNVFEHTYRRQLKIINTN